MPDAETEEARASETAASAAAVDSKKPATGSAADEPLPPMTEQISQQLGGVRGLIESGIPVAVFILANLVGREWLKLDNSLYWAIGASVAVAVTIALLRLLRKESVRYALNGLFGIAIGAYMAWKSGDEGDFYLWGIIQGTAYGVALIGSALIGHPLVGWIWAVIAGGGKHVWRKDRQLVRLFGWLSIVWGVVFLLKNILRWWLILSDMDTALGVVTLVGGYPVTALLFLFTVFMVRRARPELAPAAEPQPAA